MGQYDYNDYYNLALYANTTAMNNDYMSFREGVLLNGAIGAGIEGIRYGGGVVKNIFSKNKPSKMAKLRQRAQMRQQIKGKNIFQTYKNAWNYETIKRYESKLPKQKTFNMAEFNKLNSKQQAKYRNEVLKSPYYDDSRKALNEAKNLRGKARTKKLKEFEKAKAQANLKAYKAKYTGNLKPTTRLGKTKNFAKTATGVRAVNTGYKTLLANSSKFRLATKFVKGNALFAGFSVLADYDKFQKTKEKCGTKAMRKEIGKSIVVATAESVGFLAGAKLGGSLGTALGTAICPGLGSAIGGVAGAVIGGFLSWGAGKLAHKAMGKSEIEKAETEKARLMALKAKYHKSTRKSILISSAAKLDKDNELLKAKPEDLKAAGLQPADKDKVASATESISRIAQSEPELLAELEQEFNQAESASGSAEQQTAQTQEEQAQTQEEQAQAQQEQQEQQEQQARDAALKKTMEAFIARING